MNDEAVLIPFIAFEMRKKSGLTLDDATIRRIASFATYVDLFPPPGWELSSFGPNDIVFRLDTTPKVLITAYDAKIATTRRHSFGFFAGPNEPIVTAYRIDTPRGPMCATFSVFRRFHAWLNIVSQADDSLSEPDAVTLAARLCAAHLSESFRMSYPRLRRLRVVVTFQNETMLAAFNPFHTVDVPYHFLWQEAMDAAMNAAIDSLERAAQRIPHVTDVHEEMRDACLSLARHLSETYLLSDLLAERYLHTLTPLLRLTNEDLEYDDELPPLDEGATDRFAATDTDAFLNNESEDEEEEGEAGGI